MNSPTYVTRDAIQVMYLATADIPGGIPALWDALEAKLRSLKQRKCYGAVVNRIIYWAGVEIMEGDNPEALGLFRGTFPPATYATNTYKNWRELNLSEVIPTGFGALYAGHDVNLDAPHIEFYGSDGDMILMVPLREKSNR